MPEEKTTTIVKCPQCKTSLAWSTSNAYRPFCSKRCKLLDLGEWANESNRIAGDSTGQQDSEQDEFFNEDYSE